MVRDTKKISTNSPHADSHTRLYTTCLIRYHDLTVITHQEARAMVHERALKHLASNMLLSRALEHHAFNSQDKVAFAAMMREFHSPDSSDLLSLST